MVEGARGEEGEGHRRDRRAGEQEARAEPAGAEAAREPGDPGRPQQRAHAARPALQQLEGQDEQEEAGDAAARTRSATHRTAPGAARAPAMRQKTLRESRRIVTGPWFTRATSIIARKTPVATGRPDGRSRETKCW